ncbi:YoaK family protein [Streptomyces sp. NPDC048664]|uniref:YoaK family protein n=1 Tax=Streptomyces sp. NPDC048664 TaxID=3154505 RepID=UPI00342E0807
MATPTPPPHPSPKARGLRLVPALLVMTVVSGLIDAASYLGLGHVFTANMTGNVVILGFAAAGAPGFSVPHSLVSLASFLAGAVTGGLTERRYGTTSRRAWTRITFGVEAVLVGVAAAVAFTAPHAPDTHGTRYAAIALTAYAMGLRVATVRKLGVADLMATTVLTTTLTKLASDSPAEGGTARRVASVLSLLLGAVIGGWLMIHHGLPAALLAASLTTAALAVTVTGRE